MTRRNNRVPVYLSNEEKRDYTALAKANHRSLTALIRTLLADSYAKYEAGQTAKFDDKDNSPLITAVELVFENVESYTVPMKFIKSFSLGGLRRSLKVDNYHQKSNVKLNYDSYADSLAMSIDAHALDSLMADQYAPAGDTPRTLLQRILQFNDIAAVDVLYADGSHQYVNVYWGCFGDSTNRAMKCTEGFDGTLDISINEQNDYDPFAKVKSEHDAKKVQAKRDQAQEELYRNLLKGNEQ